MAKNATMEAPWLTMPSFLPNDTIDDAMAGKMGRRQSYETLVPTLISWLCIDKKRFNVALPRELACIF